MVDKINRANWFCLKYHGKEYVVGDSYFVPGYSALK